MSVYYKFKSAKDFDSISIDGHFISVSLLKERIFESKFGRGTGFDLVVANAQTNEEYLDEATLIPKNTSLLVRRVPVQRRMPIVTNREEPKVENKYVEEQPSKISFPTADSSVPQYSEGTEWDEFGNDLYAIPEVTPVQPDNAVQDAPSDKADEDSKIKALIDSSALDWQMQQQDGFGAGRGFGRGMGGRMMGGRGFGGRVGFERVGFERKTPPQGYVCHRCEVPGHFIQHCPTNGDPNFDKRRMKNPTGIPKDMLVMNPDGPYALPGGAVAVMKPNEAAFNREVEGISSTRSVGELPPELHCPLCKEVMKDAVLTSKCCFSSFCDRCIRNHIISKSMCICGATNILADDLLPNKTVRDTINRILESNNSSTENAGSAVQIPDTASARVNQYKPPSPTVSATSKGGNVPPSPKENIPDLKGAADSVQPVVIPSHQSLEKGMNVKAADLSEVTRESMHEKEPKLQATVLHAEEEVQQKMPTTGEAGKKKKKKKSVVPVNGSEMQWRTSQDFPPENYMMPFPQSAYDGYWGGMQMGMDGYNGMPPGYNGMPPGYNGMPPAYPGAMPYMGYAPGPFDMPFGGVFPQEPFGGQGYMMPPVGPPQRDLSGGRGISREEFEARKAGLRRKCENDRNGQRDSLKERDRGREPSGRESINNGDISSMKSKSRIPPIQETRPNSRIEETHARERPSREIAESTRHGKNRPDHQDDAEAAEHKASVFSRISFPEGGTSKKRKSSSSSDVNKSSSNISNGHKDSDLSAPSAHHKSLSNGYHEARKSSNKTGEMGAPSRAGRKSTMIMEPDSSDEEEERHFKRRPARYEPQSTEWEQDERATKSSRVSTREREREHEREYERQRGHRHSHR